MSEPWRQLIERAVISGVTERPPVPGRSHVAFGMHPVRPGPMLAIAIAHSERLIVAVDVIRENVTVEKSSILLKRYGVSGITGAQTEGDDLDLAHATCGALHLLHRRRGLS
jgi:hypothetical protein